MKLKQIFAAGSRSLKKHKLITVSKYLLSSLMLVAVLMLSVTSVYASTLTDKALLSGTHKLYMTQYENVDNTSYIPKGTTGGNMLIWDLPINIAATYGDDNTSYDTYRFCNGWMYFNLTFNFSYSYPLTGNETYTFSTTWNADGVSGYVESITSTADSATVALFISYEDFLRVRVNNALQLNLHVSGTHASITQAQMTYTVTRNSFLNKTSWSDVPAHDIDTSSIVSSISESNVTLDDIDRIVDLINTKVTTISSNTASIKNDVSAIKDAIVNSDSSQPTNPAAAAASTALADLDDAESGLINSATLAPSAIDGISSDSINIINDVTASMSFWGLVIRSFTSSGGIFWSVLLLGLSVGLFAFILRLK